MKNKWNHIALMICCTVFIWRVWKINLKTQNTFKTPFLRYSYSTGESGMIVELFSRMVEMVLICPVHQSLYNISWLTDGSGRIWGAAGGSGGAADPQKNILCDFWEMFIIIPKKGLAIYKKLWAQFVEAWVGNPTNKKLPYTYIYIYIFLYMYYIHIY